MPSAFLFPFLLLFTSTHAFSIYLRNSIPAPNSQFVVSWAHTLDTDPDQVGFAVQGQQNGSPQRTVWGPFWAGGGQTGGDVTLQSMDAGDTVVFATFTNNTILASLAFTTGSSGGSVTTGGPSQGGGSAGPTTTQKQSQGQGQGTTSPSNPSSPQSNPTSNPTSNTNSNSNSKIGAETNASPSSSLTSQTANNTSPSFTTTSFPTPSTSLFTPTPPDTNTNTNNSPDSSSNSDKLPTILGVVFGILTVLLILIVLLICRRRRRRNVDELLADPLNINSNRITRPSTMFTSEVTIASGSSVSNPKLPDEKVVERPLPSLPSPQTTLTTSSFFGSAPVSVPEREPAPNPHQLLEELNWWRSQFSSEWNGISGGAPPVYSGHGTTPLSVPSVPP